MAHEDINVSLPHFSATHLSSVIYISGIVSLSAWCSNIYLFFAGQWHALPNFPNPNKWGYSTVSLNNDVYVTGGSGASNPLKHSRNFPGTQQKSFDKCLWTELSVVFFYAEWKTLSDFWTCALVFLTGGSRGLNTNTWSTTETWKYITREGRWVTVAPMLRPRTNHTSATLNGEIYVIGGKKINTVQHVVPSTCSALENFDKAICC